MSKKKNSKNQVNDVVITSDELAYMIDDDLRNLHESLRKEREYASREGHNTKNVEMMLCYVQREMEIRDIRRAAHFRYMKENGITFEDQNTQAADVSDEAPVLH